MKAGGDTLNCYSCFLFLCHFKCPLKRKVPLFAGLSLSSCYRSSTTYSSLKSRPEPKVEVVKIKECVADHCVLIQMRIKISRFHSLFQVPVTGFIKIFLKLMIVRRLITVSTDQFDKQNWILSESPGGLDLGNKAHYL
ncbi:MAG TPA: hypothetical protein VFW11_09795, partial [Cyclobacteriaceae bacterium]|nr:hypothetical protein [Cyclobacteriaceae bacterium]